MGAQDTWWRVRCLWPGNIRDDRWFCIDRRNGVGERDEFHFQGAAFLRIRERGDVLHVDRVEVLVQQALALRFSALDEDLGEGSLAVSPPKCVAGEV